MYQDVGKEYSRCCRVLPRSPWRSRPHHYCLVLPVFQFHMEVLCARAARLDIMSEMGWSVLMKQFMVLSHARWFSVVSMSHGGSILILMDV